METRSRTRYLLRGAAVLAALGALTMPATAGAAVKAPVIKKVTPRSVGVGDKLIIRGKYFRVGKGRNRVLFARSGGKSLFVKADLSTKKRMTVIIPKRLEKYLPQPGGSPAPAVFRLRVLTKRLSRHFTSKWNSPVVGPRKPKVVPPSVTADGDCDGDGVLNSVETDDDDDLLPDTTELSIGTDPCNPDSDGDGVGDGYEYQSAIDLNGTGVPSKYRLPYPNALQKDAGVDYDGDGLSLGTEYSLWKYAYASGHVLGQPTLTSLYYSDGTQHSHGTLTDDERDEDNDGLSNWDEITGRMTPGFWTACYSSEGTYPVPFTGTSPTDPDSDSDGILDGADDQDHDGLTNVQELSRSLAVAAVGGTHADQWGSVKCKVASSEQPNALDPQGRVNPFNPCLPDKNSPTCERHPAFGLSFAPFDDNGDKYLVLN